MRISPKKGGFCAFCSGNERTTPPEILAFRADGSKPNTPGWSLRVVQNKFPALNVEGNLDRKGEGIFDKMNGVGAHEVIIESPEHNLTLSTMPIKSVEDTLWAFHQRIKDLKNDKRIKYVLVFKNEGDAAGASLEHTHSQLIALPIVPQLVEEEIERSLARRVSLKSGGYLIMDQTEALTTVDVNTGGFVGGRSFDDTIFKTNLEAAQVIARQLRLRNLGGIIIIDFIDMDNEVHREAVLGEFKKALTLDRTRVTVNGFSQLGLVEMTRKRTRESLAHILCEPCPVCHGRGELKTPQTICYQVLRELLRESRQFAAREFRILASQTVIDMFLDEESQSLAMLAEFIEKPISLQVESMYNQEQYDIILM